MGTRTKQKEERRLLTERLEKNLDDLEKRLSEKLELIRQLERELNDDQEEEERTTPDE